ncbi:hypothetical protein [Thermococcus sp. AM4]|uniref:hypothetical protein n=1 Tax=Thermococcus sp. (strain AM4) TaxID=246969 RepID=UPI00018706EB|nr:hypothetical protein [Thermococcus sp. AM4]EEB74130.1 conserved hypothetical protein [Thermococcus sp. AM4]
MAVTRERFEMLVRDLVGRFSQADERKIREALDAFVKVTEIPVSYLNPASSYHPVVVFKKRFGNLEKSAMVSLLEFRILNRYNMPGWRREVEFRLDRDVVLRERVGGIEAVLIGDPTRLARLRDVMMRILQQMSTRPRNFVMFYSHVYMDFGNNRFIHLEMKGSDVFVRLVNLNFTEASRLLGKAIPYMDSVFGNKNIDFYKLLFVYSSETAGTFDWFFHRYVMPRLNPEQREFLNDMHDYRNFIRLLYSYVARLNKDRLGDEIGIRVARRANPNRPLEIGIAFTNRGIEVKRYPGTVTISFMV